MRGLVDIEDVSVVVIQRPLRVLDQQVCSSKTRSRGCFGAGLTAATTALISTTVTIINSPCKASITLLDANLDDARLSDLRADNRNMWSETKARRGARHR